MKKFRHLLVSAMLLSAIPITAYSYVNAESNTSSPQETVQSTEELSDNLFKPGDYDIEVNGHNGPFTVTVSFDEKTITDIQVGEHDETRFMAEQSIGNVLSQILGEQTLDVDTTSGATISGAVVLGAVKQAVEEAGGSVDSMMIPREEDSTVWEDTYTEIVVVGAGAAGMAATMEAYDLGADVIVVEQLDLIGGSSTRAGYMVGGDSVIQEQQGIDYSTEDWIDQFLTISSSGALDPGLYHEETAREMAMNAGENINWLYELGVEFGPVNLDWQHYGPEGARLGPFAMEAFQDQLDERDIDYRLSTRADEIIVEDGKVVGITVESPNGQMYNIYADAVILATGGYFGSQEMVEEYNPDFVGFPTDVSIGSDGSGMVMAEEAGGNLVYMDQANYHGLAAYWNGASRSLTLPAGNGGIAVNKDAKRYADEAGDYTALTYATLDQKDQTVYTIMDQTLMNLDVIQNDHGLSNIQEMWTKADTIEELAEKLGLDPDALKETVENYSFFVQNGEDLDFGKAPQYMRSDFF